MTLQQMKYADAVATYGSISEAARRVFVTQPTLTESLRTLEDEARTAIYTRSARGQILDDAARIAEKYTGKAVRRPQFSVSCQHFAFATDAFMDVVKANGADAYDFTLRETTTSEIIDDVSRHRSEIGVLYLSSRNRTPLEKIFKKEELVFEELFSANPHVFLGRKHPLARKQFIRPEELDDYPYLSYEQGMENALYFAEAVMPAIDRRKNIRVRDRATMTNLILGLDGFTAASGAHAPAYNPAIVPAPLKRDATLSAGTIRRAGIQPSKQAEAFAAAMRRLITASR